MHPRLQPGQEILGSLLSTFQLKYGNRIYSQLHANIYCSIGADVFVAPVFHRSGCYLASGLPSRCAQAPWTWMKMKMDHGP